MRSVGNRLGTTQTQDFVLLGAIALLGYVVYNIVSGVKAGAQAVGAGAQAVANALTSTGNAIGSGLYSLFGPTDAQALGETVFLTVSFPDGRHAVPSGTINPDGTFAWSGYPAGSQPVNTYQLVKDANGAWYATINTDFGVTNPTEWS